MRDWKRLVEERLAGLKLPASVKEDVVAELAAHLEDSAAMDPETGGTPDRALGHIQWHKLVREIEHTKCEEAAMNHRTKTVWLPAIAILFAAGLTLMFLGREAFVQRLIWWACMAMLLCTAASEAKRLNQRTKSIWLPGVISLMAATLLMFALEIVPDSSLFFREMTLYPHDLLRGSPGSPRSFYLLWLLAQVAFGALGAFFSSRMGGSRKARIIAGAFPAVVIVGAYVLLVPVTSQISGKAFNPALPAYLGSAVVVWMLAPAVAVLAGALPFLREPNLSEAQPQ